MAGTPRKESRSVTPLKRITAALDDGVRAFIIKGAAGTGKTTLIRELLPLLAERRFAVQLLAPTGRAAKMIQLRTECAASTIHSCIFRIKDPPVESEEADEDLKWVFPLKTDRPAHTAFIVDESSMVGEAKHVDGILQFGSGALLHDVLDYSGVELPDSDNIVFFVGDPYQLPPVGERPTEPPALNKEMLSGLIGYKVEEIELNEVYRQSGDSGILVEANRLRASIAYHQFFSFALQSHRDVVHVAENDFGRLYSPAQRLNDKIVIAYTNERVWEYNQKIRALLGKKSALPMPGERLLSLRNTKVALRADREEQFMNGDMLEVVAIDSDRQVKIEGFYRPKGADTAMRFEFVFCKMILAWLYEDGRQDAETWVNVTPILSEDYREHSEYASVALYVAVANRIREKYGLKNNKVDNERLREYLKNSAFYHAPMVTFGYAITGHKSQGGEWPEAWVDYRYPGGLMNEAYFRWLYTVTTRAKHCLYAITPPTLDDIAEAMERKLATLPTECACPGSPALPLDQILHRHGLRMTSVSKKPFAVRVQIANGEDMVAELGTIDLNYKQTGMVSFVKMTFPGASDALGADVAALKGRNVKSVLPEETPSAADIEVSVEPVHERIHARLVAAAEHAGIRVLSIKSLTVNQLRLSVASVLGDGYVDFYVDGKGRVTEMGSMTISAETLRALRKGLV